VNINVIILIRTLYAALDVLDKLVDSSGVLPDTLAEVETLVNDALNLLEDD
jgi:hypothetical protein